MRCYCDITPKYEEKIQKIKDAIVKLTAVDTALNSDMPNQINNLASSYETAVNPGNQGAVSYSIRTCNDVLRNKVQQKIVDLYDIEEELEHTYDVMKREDLDYHNAHNESKKETEKPQKPKGPKSSVTLLN